MSEWLPIVKCLHAEVKQQSNSHSRSESGISELDAKRRETRRGRKKKSSHLNYIHKTKLCSLNYS